MEELLKEGTEIFHKNENYKIWGKIVGISSNELVIIGVTYIIKIDHYEGNINYEYSCIALPRVMFKVI